MASAAELSVLLKARDEASGVLGKVEGRLKSLGGTFEKHRRGIGMGMAGIGAAVTGLAGMAIKSSLDQQKGINALDQSLKNIGTSYAANKESIEALTAAQQAKTNFGDEQQRKALQGLVQITGDYGLSMDTMIPLMDMAAATGMDLERASVLVGRAVNGEASALSRYGIILDSNADSTEVLTALTETFGGQAEANADPITQLTNRLGDLMQVLGDALLPIMEAILPKIEGMIRKWIEFAEANPTLTKVILIVAGALGAAMLVLGPMLLILPQLFAGMKLFAAGIRIVSAAMKANPIGALIGILTLLAMVLLPIVIKNWDKIWAAIQKTTQTVVNIVIKIINGLTKAWRESIAFIIDLVRTAMNKMPGFVKNAIPGFKEMERALDGVSDKLREGIPPIDFYNEKQNEVADTSLHTADAADIAALQMGSAIRGTAEVYDTESGKMVASLEKSNEAQKEQVKVVTEAAIEIARQQRAIADAAQEAGDESQTAAQKTSAALKAEMDKRDKYFEDSAAQAIKSTKFMEEQIKIALVDDMEDDFAMNLQMMEEWGLGQKKVVEGAAAVTIENLEKAKKAREADEKSRDQSLDRLRLSLDKTMVAWKDSGSSMEDVIKRWAEKTGMSVGSVINRLDDLDVNTNDVKATLLAFTKETGEDFLDWKEVVKGAAKEAADALKDAEKAAGEAAKIAAEEQQRMVEKYKGTPQFKSMAEQQEKLRTVQHALETQKGALPSMRESVTQAKAGFNQYRGEQGSPGFQQRSDQYWSTQIRPKMDQVQRQVERISATEQQISNLQNQIARNVIPLEYRGIAENVLANEWMRPMQHGGVSSGGLSLVGERGPEIVSLPGGARVHPSGSGPSANTFIFNGAVYGVEDLRRVVVEAVRDHALSGGFTGVFAEA